MGYYVTLTKTNASIPADKLDEAYRILCDLNNDNTLKNGSVLGHDEKDGPHEGIWFSWMEWNYPEVYDNAVDILRAVGYDIFIDTWDYQDPEQSHRKGAVYFTGYDEKHGCEDVFAEALLPVLVSDDDQPIQFQWTGQDGELWRKIAVDGTFVTQEGEVVFSEVFPDP